MLGSPATCTGVSSSQSLIVGSAPLERRKVTTSHWSHDDARGREGGREGRREREGGRGREGEGGREGEVRGKERDPQTDHSVEVSVHQHPVGGTNDGRPGIIHVSSLAD